MEEVRAMLTCAAASAALVCLAAVAPWLGLNLTSAAFLQLLIVLLIALKFGFWAATAASIAGNLALNYFLIPPVHSLGVADPQNWMALLFVEISALLVSSLSIQARSEAAVAKTREDELECLYRVSRAVLQMPRRDSLAQEIVTLLHRQYPIAGIALFSAVDATTASIGEVPTGAFENLRSAYLQNHDVNTSACRICLLRTAGRSIGSIAFIDPALSPIAASSLASLVALAWERALSWENENQAAAEAKTEQLRATVLEALGHEYKTPLTAMSTAVGGLLAMGGLNHPQQELISLVDDQVRRLSSLTSRLLRTARLDGLALNLRPESIDPGELLQSVIQASRPLTASHPVHLSGLNNQASIWADRQLVEIALSQLLDNAAKYSDPGSPIVVAIDSQPFEVKLSVNNQGPAIAAEECEHIFRRFYRAPAFAERTAGTGLGLSIARKVAEAHKGRAWVTSDAELGNTFFLALPRVKAESSL